MGIRPTPELFQPQLPPRAGGGYGGGGGYLPPSAPPTSIAPGSPLGGMNNIVKVPRLPPSFPSEPLPPQSPQIPGRPSIPAPTTISPADAPVVPNPFYPAVGSPTVSFFAPFFPPAASPQQSAPVTATLAGNQGNRYLLGTVIYAIVTLDYVQPDGQILAEIHFNPPYRTNLFSNGGTFDFSVKRGPNQTSYVEDQFGQRTPDFGGGSRIAQDTTIQNPNGGQLSDGQPQSNAPSNYAAPTAPPPAIPNTPPTPDPSPLPPGTPVPILTQPEG